MQGQTIALRASAAQLVGTETGAGVGYSRPWREASVVLDVTAAATDVGDTLDVYVDVSFDAGTSWVNAIHFAQVLGNGGAKKFVAPLSLNPAATAPVDVSADASVGVVRQIGVGTKMRVRGVVVDADADGSFTWSCVAMLKG